MVYLIGGMLFVTGTLGSGSGRSGSVIFGGGFLILGVLGSGLLVGLVFGLKFI